MRLANEIQKKLIGWCRSNTSDIVLPNFFQFGYEMDVFKLMQSGFVVEYEIKISRADFKNDFNKGATGQDSTSKHDDLKNGKAANRFYFVTTADLVCENEVPQYAGLMYYYGNQLAIIKTAPIIHRNKFSNFRALAMICSFREAQWRGKYNFLRYEHEKLKGKLNKTAAA